MYRKQRLRIPEPTTYVINLADFSKGINREVDENLLSANYAQNAYNVRTEDKSLKNGYGFKPLSMPNSALPNVENVFQVPSGVAPLALWEQQVADKNGKRARILMLYGSNKKFYYTLTYGLSNQFMDSEITFNQTPMLLSYVYNGLETAVMASPEDPLMLWNGSTPQVSDSNLHLNSLCCHYERLFAGTSDNLSRVRFSKDFEILNWTEQGDNGGFIDLADERGAVRKVISFNDYVYVVRDFGISRISAYGDQSDFSVTHINLTSNHIYANTASLCGDCIIMLTSDGLHYVVDSKLYKYDFKINSMIDKSKLEYATACYFNGKYYLAISLNFNDGVSVGCENETDFHNNALIEFDINTQKINIIRGVDICSLCPIVFDKFNKLAVCFHGQMSGTLGELCEGGTMIGQALPKAWATPMSDLGINKRKLVRSIKLCTDTDLDIIVKSEWEQQKLKAYASPHQQELHCNVVGDRVGVEIKTNSNTLYLSNPQIVVDAFVD